METSSIRAFVMTASEGSVTRAAEKLHITQPALSQQLRRLEDTLGTSLFLRKPKGLELTVAGQQLLPAAQQALAALQVLDGQARSLRRSIQGRLRIGTIIDPEFLRLGAWLGWLRRWHPGVHLELRHGMSGTVTDAVLQGDLDVAFTLGPPGLTADQVALDVIQLAEFRYRVIAPPGWHERVVGQGWEVLACLPWLATPPQSVHARLLSAAFAERDLSPPVAAEVDLEQSMLELVRSGVGLALARDTIAQHAAHTQGVVIADQVSIPAALGFVVHRTALGQPTVDAAQAGIRAVWEVDAPPGRS